MSTAGGQVAVGELPPPKSFGARLVGVFISPSPTFADIARKPDFLFPLIVAVIAALAVTETMLAKIGMERIVRLSIEQSSRAASMSPEQMEQAVTQGAKFGAVLAHLGALLGPPIGLLIIAGLGLLIVNGIFGAQLNFRTAFSVTCYANLVTILGALMALLLVLFGDAEHFNPQNFVPSNVGFFLNPSETSKPVYSLAGSLDLFTIWLIGLLGIGFSEATGSKVKTTSVLLSYLGLWIIWVLGKMGFAILR